MSQHSEDLVPVEYDEIVVSDEPTVAERQAEVAAEIADVSADLARLALEATQMQVDPEETGSALVPTTGTAAQAKKRLAVLRANVQRQTQAMESKQAEIRERQEHMKDLMQKQMQLMREQMEPLEKFVARLNEGIWMVNLYLGRDEQIVTLRDGEPAPADEIVVIRQLVLAMDEECAVDPENDGIDATNIEEFDKWLKADPAHVDQVIPNQKGVVALRPRFISKRYDDPWKNSAVDEANKQTYFLIRNGEKLYRTWTEFNVGERLVPNADEFSSFFFETRHKFGSKQPDVKVPIEPGTLAWERAEESADARQRHFMRVALILQGLVDRTTVFHPLPDRGISFSDFDHNGKTWTFLMDAEMAIGTGRKPFREWLAEKNEQLQVGMRIVGAFTATGFRDHSYDHGYRNSRLRPPNAELPESGALHVIEDQEGKAFVIRYERGEKVWTDRWIPDPGNPGWGHRGGFVKPQKRASALLYAEDRFIIPFDLVTEEEMITYLNARLDRHAYAAMFPLLKATIHAKRAERAEEEPFRVMLSGVLARENGVEVADALADLDSLIEWFKLTNKNHRPLVGSEEEQAKAVRLIVDEHGRRLNAKVVSDAVVVRVLKAEPSAILVGRKRDGKYIALVPENDGNVFVKEVEFGARGNVTGEPKRWRLMPALARRARWQIAMQTERFDAWDFNASLNDHLTGPEFERLTARVMKDSGEGAYAVAYRPQAREFHTWRLTADAVIDTEHPLSGKDKDVEVDHVERKWYRSNGEAHLHNERRSHHSGWTDQLKPWDTRTKDGKPSPYRDATVNLFVVLHEDAKVEAHVEAERARHAAARSRAREMQACARGLVGSIEAAWVKRKEATEYARFLEEFLDPELWEGHRKTLSRDAFSYPHSHWGGWSESPDAVGLMVEYAVETGIDLDGMTVWEAATEHFPPVEWLKRRLRVRADDGMARVRRSEMPEAIDVPADVREFRFVMPEPEPDDEDDLIEEGVLGFEEE